MQYLEIFFMDNMAVCSYQWLVGSVSPLLGIMRHM